MPQPSEGYRKVVHLDRTAQNAERFVTLTNQGMQWASCNIKKGMTSPGKSKGAGGVKYIWVTDEQNEKLRKLGIDLARGGFLLTLASPLTLGAMAILGIPMFLAGTVIAVAHPPKWLIIKKP